jgi:hypothetical protein
MDCAGQTTYGLNEARIVLVHGRGSSGGERFALTPLAASLLEAYAQTRVSAVRRYWIGFRDARLYAKALIVFGCMAAVFLALITAALGKYAERADLRKLENWWTFFTSYLPAHISDTSIIIAVSTLGSLIVPGFALLYKFLVPKSRTDLLSAEQIQLFRNLEANLGEIVRHLLGNRPALILLIDDAYALPDSDLAYLAMLMRPGPNTELTRMLETLRLLIVSETRESYEGLATLPGGKKVSHLNPITVLPFTPIEVRQIVEAHGVTDRPEYDQELVERAQLNINRLFRANSELRRNALESELAKASDEDLGDPDAFGCDELMAFLSVWMLPSMNRKELKDWLSIKTNPALFQFLSRFGMANLTETASRLVKSVAKTHVVKAETSTLYFDEVDCEALRRVLADKNPRLIVLAHLYWFEFWTNDPRPFFHSDRMDDPHTRAKLAAWHVSQAGSLLVQVPDVANVTVAALRTDGKFLGHAVSALLVSSSVWADEGNLQEATERLREIFQWLDLFGGTEVPFVEQLCEAVWHTYWLTGSAASRELIALFQNRASSASQSAAFQINLTTISFCGVLSRLPYCQTRTCRLSRPQQRRLGSFQQCSSRSGSSTDI